VNEWVRSLVTSLIGLPSDRPSMASIVGPRPESGPASLQQVSLIRSLLVGMVLSRASFVSQSVLAKVPVAPGYYGGLWLEAPFSPFAHPRLFRCLVEECTLPVDPCCMQCAAPPGLFIDKPAEYRPHVVGRCHEKWKMPFLGLLPVRLKPPQKRPGVTAVPKL